MNLHIIGGRLGHDPELEQLPSGTSVCNVSIATDESYKDREGQSVKRTTWHRVTLFGSTAESFAQHVAKGRSVTITGSVRRRKGSDGNGGEREYVDTIARTWEFAGSDKGATARQGGQGQPRGRNGNGRRPNRQRRAPAQNPQRQQRSQAPQHDEDWDDDIPF